MSLVPHIPYPCRKAEGLSMDHTQAIRPSGIPLQRKKDESLTDALRREAEGTKGNPFYYMKREKRWLRITVISLHISLSVLISIPLYVLITQNKVGGVIVPMAWLTIWFTLAFLTLISYRRHRLYRLKFMIEEQGGSS